jgi:hypothetical protein
LYPRVPHFFLVCQPILNKTGEIQIKDPMKHDFLGFIGISIYWRDLLTDLLSPGSNGIVIVFENSCNPTFTYQVNGPDVTFLGRGDLHDHKYDSMEIGVSELKCLGFRHLKEVFRELRVLRCCLPMFRTQQAWLLDLDSFSLGRRSYTGLPVVNDTCPYYLRLFPSKTMANDYYTNNPALFTACAVLIFAFTSAVFIVYDRLVEKRQKTVMTSAVHTSAIVSSLFPSTVRGRLFEPAGDSSSQNGLPHSQGLVTFGDKMVSRPIADLYPSATVMFADM